MDKDIERFIELVKTEANKKEDFVLDRVKKTTLYKLLESRYENIDELTEMALKKASWFERMRSAMEYEWKKALHQRAYRDTAEKNAERLVFYIETTGTYKEITEKCMWRYGRDKLLELAKNIVDKYPADGTLIGKFVDEVSEEWRG